MLVVNSLTAGGGNTLVSDVITNGTVFNEQATVSLSVVMKDVAIVAPTPNNQVTINRYRVEYRRADGHNTPGVDVPHPFDGAMTLTIPAGGTAAAVFELVRHIAKEEPPLVYLRTNPNIISTLTDVTFYGTDLVGNDVSATGSLTINFGNVGN
jgi:hypothetical protein